MRQERKAYLTLSTIWGCVYCLLELYNHIANTVFKEWSITKHLPGITSL